MRQVLRHVVGGLCVVLLTAGHRVGAGRRDGADQRNCQDTSGAVLPGVDVTVTQTDTNFTRSAVTEPKATILLPTCRSGRTGCRRASPDSARSSAPASCCR